MAAFPVLRRIGKLSRADAGSIAAHCGSISVITLLATLYASASYIAAPAAMRLAVLQANPALSIGAALGITFPFNLIVGIPLYHRLARFLPHAGG